jgi:hypothetical protein
MVCCVFCICEGLLCFVDTVWGSSFELYRSMGNAKAMEKGRRAMIKTRNDYGMDNEDNAFGSSGLSS